jgi:hypothetical protein
MALVTRSGPALTRTGISVRTTTPGVGTAALAVIGGDHGGIVATRRITAGCRAAAGNSYVLDEVKSRRVGGFQKIIKDRQSN